jgi:hypothetical protein
MTRYLIPIDRHGICELPFMKFDPPVRPPAIQSSWVPDRVAFHVDRCGYRGYSERERERKKNGSCLVARNLPDCLLIILFSLVPCIFYFLNL